MGYMGAYGFAEVAEREHALKWHLLYNHVPSVPGDMLEPARQAIDAMLADEPDTIIETPYPHKRYGQEVPASEVVEALHLWAFIDQAIDQDMA